MMGCLNAMVELGSTKGRKHDRASSSAVGESKRGSYGTVPLTDIVDELAV